MLQHANNMPQHIDCPRDLFWQHLKAFLTEELGKGNQLIVAGDFNSDYSKVTVWMLNIGLHDLISEQHEKCPITYNRSHKDPLDGIFGSEFLLSS